MCVFAETCRLAYFYAMCHGMHAEVRGQPVRVHFLPYHVEFRDQTCFAASTFTR